MILNFGVCRCRSDNRTKLYFFCLKIRGIRDFAARIGGDINSLYDPAVQLEKQARDRGDKHFLLYEDQSKSVDNTV